MAGEAGSSSAPPRTRSATCSQHARGSGSSPSTAPADAAAGVQVQNASDAERRLDLLMQEIEKLAPLLSQAELRAAVARVQSLVTGARLQEAITGSQRQWRPLLVRTNPLLRNAPWCLHPIR